MNKAHFLCYIAVIFFLSCKEKKPCVKKPRKPKPPCPPVVKSPQVLEKTNPCDTTVKIKLSVVRKLKCKYWLWNPDHTQYKIFSTAEARKKFADEHGLILTLENN